MVAEAGVVAPRRQVTGRDDIDTVAQLSRWLLLAVGLDLFLTRLLARLTIVIPKEESLATAGALLGRIGAATDVLVPIVGMLLLVALLLQAGRNGDRTERVMLVGLSVVAGGGLALVYVSPTPVVVVALDLVVAAVAIGSGIRIARGAATSIVARAGFMALATALATAAIGRMIGVAAVVAGPSGTWSGEAAGLAVGALGQAAFVVGAALVGLAGVRRLILTERQDLALAGIGLAAGLVVLLAAAGAPAMWGILEIWSVGLAGVVPSPAIALALGLAVAGLPALYGRAPAAAVGASIVLFAGYGLSASGLVLAGMLGLVVASND